MHYEAMEQNPYNHNAPITFDIADKPTEFHTDPSIYQKLILGVQVNIYYTN